MTDLTQTPTAETQPGTHDMAAFEVDMAARGDTAELLTRQQRVVIPVGELAMAGASGPLPVLDHDEKRIAYYRGEEPGNFEDSIAVARATAALTDPVAREKMKVWAKQTGQRERQNKAWADN